MGALERVITHALVGRHDPILEAQLVSGTLGGRNLPEERVSPGRVRDSPSLERGLSR